MAKNALRLISNGLRGVQTPSRVRTLSLVGPIHSVGKSVRQFSHYKYNFQCHLTMEELLQSHVDCPPLAINGFGRIGKCLLHMATQEKLNIVAINQPGVDIRMVARILLYDTLTQDIRIEVEVIDENSLAVHGKLIRLYTEKDPENIDWGDLVDYVIDTTGKFTKDATAKKHMAAGVKKVIISDPSEDVPMFVRGVNFDKYNEDMNVVSCASSATNCAATLLHAINEKYGVEHCILTTVQSLNSSQNDLNGVPQKWNIPYMVRKTTDVVKAVGIIIPSLEGKVTGDSIGVPVDDISLQRLYIRVKDPVKLRELKSRDVWESAVVSSNYVEFGITNYFGSCCSAVVDLNQLSVFDDKFLTIGAWYDTNRGYSSRLLDLYKYMVKLDTKCCTK